MQDDLLNQGDIEQGFFLPPSRILFIDITGFAALITACFEAAGRAQKKSEIQKLLEDKEWRTHYQDAHTGRRVLSHSAVLEHKHEEWTAVLLAKMNYDVLFVPRALFKRSEKRYDVLLLRDNIILKADLKSITSKNPDTIGNRIKEGSDQAARIVIDIRSDITGRKLIEGLRTGCYRNKLLKEILLFYKNKFHILPKNFIESNKIFEVIK